ncbi:tyrosine-protein phosphatase [Novosphingobium sp.]|uniref:tyrosine-protein phosphatase n=1 Tax=Novosphingobium sp. TaxID=1874826 RepID=UPI00286BD2ED|nr:tyrosine-protein phosphatase [Novosphingobium sp.]
MERVFKLDGVHNFRDYGGYAAADGAKIKAGVLWRSAQHGDASDADLVAIDALALQAVIDLRGPSERSAKPCRRSDSFAAQVFTYPEETAGLALHTEAADGVVSEAEARAAMLRLYDGIAFRENLVPMLRCYFEVLLRSEGPSLVHCVAGKDRTGFAVALVQHALGVSRDDIVADYMLTNVAGNIEARIAAGAEQIRAHRGAITDATIRVLMGVEEDYIVAAFAAVEARHGDLDAYLAEVIGVDAAAIEELRADYLG